MRSGRIKLESIFVIHSDKEIKWYCQRMCGGACVDVEILIINLTH